MDELGFEPETIGTEVWNAGQWPNFFYVKMYKFCALKLNNFKIGGGSSWKPKLSAISPFTDGSPSIIGFEEDPPDFKAIEPRKSIPYAKSSYFMK